MDKEEFKRIVSNPQYIEGVYNYCDRWCERCRFRAKCANYAVSEEQLIQDNPDADPDEAFWDNVNEMFEITMDMIQEIAEEKGLNLDLADPDAYAEQQKNLDEKCRTHECTSAGSEYIKMVEEWFEKAEDLLQNKEDNQHPDIHSLFPNHH